MNVVVIAGRKFTGPAGWNELTPAHYRQVLNWRVHLAGVGAGRLILLRLWFGIPNKLLRRLTDEQRVDLLALLDFLDDRPERWMLPRLRVKVRTYLGPGDGLEHLTFGEFMYAQAARDRYLADQQPTDLAELLASLYRPKAWIFQKASDGGRRLFDRRELEHQATVMASLPLVIQQGVLANYEGCLDHFPDQFKYLFKSSGNDSEGGTWLDVGISLARSTSALGTFADLERANLFLVLTTLDAIMKENAELKAQQEQWKS